MSKQIRRAVMCHVPLLIWFFLDMTGFRVGQHVLVARSYQDDGIFFLVYLAALICFVMFNKIGKVILPICLSLWLLAQVYFHWYVTIWGPWESNNKYFADTIKVFPQTQRYFPDLYHLVLHVLIVITLIATVRFLKNRHSR